jgi:hypothetical protein
VEQGIFIMSNDPTHPVLLYLHGGMSDYFLTQKFPTGLEDYFTVIWWEQRGSGLSSSNDIPPEMMTVEQLISDTLVVTNYLRHRFGQEKNIPDGTFGGNLHWHPGGCTGSGVVQRLHWRGPDIVSTQI